MSFNNYEFMNLMKKDIRDGLRDYCICENTNEEYIRSTISKSRLEQSRMDLLSLLTGVLKLGRGSKGMQVKRVRLMKG